MQPIPIQDELEDDGVIDLDSYSETSQKNDTESLKKEEESDGIIDMQDYSNSSEEQEASWGDLTKDVIVQPALGLASAFTWPLDLLKIGMVGESLSDLDELEMAFKKVGKNFDREKYIKTVSEQSQFIPTQDLAEDIFEKGTGIGLKPKSETGKKIRKFFTLVGLLRGKGLTKAATGATVGIGTSTALKSVGVNETVSDFIGDITAAGTTALSKSPREFAPEVAELENIAKKNGLPFPEYLTLEPKDLKYPKISETRKVALQKEMGLSSQEAIDEIISGKLPISKVKKQGFDLDVLTDEAYDKVTALSKSNPKKLPTKQIVNDLESEIARIKSKAPSPSSADKVAIRILEQEKNILEKANPNTEELIQQIRNYNSDASTIYKKAEFSGSEDAARSAYAFMNNSIRNTIESESGTEVRLAMKTADALNGEKFKLKRVESLVSKATKDGNYDPKKLQTLLNSKQGLIVRRELGDQAVNEIRDIAKYGEQAQKATLQLAKSPGYLGNISEWGPFAGFLLYKMPKTAGLLIGAKSIGDRIRGYLMTRPATREIYKDIIKNAADGSFKTMAVDFSKLESAVNKDFGNFNEFIKAMEDEDLEVIND